MNSSNQPNYYRQQMIRGQPVYVEVPDRGGRGPAVRSGAQTRQAREQAGQGPYGGFRTVFSSKASRDDSDDQSDLGRGSSSRFDVDFTTIQLRNGFIQKVYGILCVQLLITFGFIFIAIHVQPIKIFLLKNVVIFYVALGLTLVFVIALSCFQAVRRNFPWNFICLFIITVLYAYILAVISCLADTTAIYLATGCTALICFLVSILACQMKWDITQCGCLLCIMLIGLLVYGIVCMVLVNFVDPETFRIMHMVYGGIGLVIFILYLAFDTQMIMGGRRLELSPEEYILGALQLYLDIIMIFQFVLMLFRN